MDLSGKFEDSADGGPKGDQSRDTSRMGTEVSGIPAYNSATGK
jgi:hypothetical protein